MHPGATCNRRFAWAAALVLSTIGVAEAQTVIRDPNDIAACLCLERDIDRLKADYLAIKQQYDTRDSQATSLTAELDRERPLVNSEDERAVDAFRQKLVRMQQIAAERDGSIPNYQAAARRHNEQVARFDQLCKGKFYDGDLLPRVQSTLVCPAR